MVNVWIVVAMRNVIYVMEEEEEPVVLVMEIKNVITAIKIAFKKYVR